MSKKFTIKVGKKDCALKYTFASIERLEREHDINLFDPNTLSNLGPTKLKLLVWAGVLHEAPKASPDDISASLEMGSLNEVSEAMTAALQEAIGV